MEKTKRELQMAIKRCDRIIDNLVDLQDLGFGHDSVARSLEAINSYRASLEERVSRLH